MIQNNHPRFTHALKSVWSRGWFLKTNHEKHPNMKTTVLFALFWVFLFPFASFSQSNQEEALLRELSLSYSLLQEEASAFVQTKEQKASKPGKGQGNQAQITQQGYQNNAFIWQSGNRNDAALQQQGLDNESATVQKGNQNSYSLVVKGDRNTSTGFQLGDNNTVEGYLQGNGLIHEVYQIGNGNEVLQEGFQTLSIKIKQEGNGLKAIIK